MIFPSDFEKRIGFDQLRERLLNYCLCDLGKDEVRNIGFSVNQNVIEAQLNQNLEFKSIFEKAESYPDQHFHDPREYLDLAAVEGNYLNADVILTIRNSLVTISDWTFFLAKRKEIYPALFKLSEPVHVPGPLLQYIDSKIGEDGKVKDNASPDLVRIRKRIVSEQSRVRKVMESVLRAAVDNNLIATGTQPAFRDGRVVIPVSAENKRRVKGFIIDESATGQTVFIEPAEVMEANNEIRDLQHEEKREEIRILKDITRQIGSNISTLQACYYFLGKIDLNRAKAKLAMLLESERPAISGSPAINWYQARHPLLFILLKEKKTIVPLTIELNNTDRFLLISGPNAGGKSVCLKTVGLLQYMFQCGLLVPANTRSAFGIFRSIFLDIGDQQSIENDLSTYSSHLKNMAAFIANADHDSLVLIDEMGAGTDPNFGGGIAEAVLTELIDRKAWGVVTTHYYNLKSLAANTKGIRNAAMLFDTRKLEPLFQLEIGKPGSSFAMELARKSNLPASTITKAGKLIGEGLTGLETLMKKVMEDKQTVEQEKRELLSNVQKLNMDKEKYEKLIEEVESKKKDIVSKARMEASLLLQNTNREIEKTIRHIKENKAEKKETKKVREKLKGLTQQVKPEDSDKQKAKEKFVAGDYVRLPGQELSGTILAIQGNKAIVQFGLIKSTVELSNLLKGKASENTRIFRSSGININEKRAGFNSTIDLRGKRGEEAIGLVDNFLDEAILLSAGEIRILHGKGEGILRKMIRDHLKRNKFVASISDEQVERGGDGISVVVLK